MGYFKYSYYKKINRFSKLICITIVENCIYLKTVHLDTKKCHICGHKGHKFSHCRFGGGIIQKIKNRYSTLQNKQQLKKYKENT